MGCPEPANSFERDGSIILRQPMQVAPQPQTGGLVLSNAAGRIDLAPVR